MYAVSGREEIVGSDLELCTGIMSNHGFDAQDKINAALDTSWRGRMTNARVQSALREFVAAEQQYLKELQESEAAGLWLPVAMDEDLAVAVEQQRALLGLIRLGRLSRLPVEVAQQ